MFIKLEFKGLQKHWITTHYVVPENIHSPPMEGFLVCTLSPHLNSKLFFYQFSVVVMWDQEFLKSLHTSLKILTALKHQAISAISYSNEN